MSKLPRRIGVLTGGGDCPGLNAVLRAVTKDALYDGVEVLGIEDGYLGLIEDRVRPLSDPEVSQILTRGGTILGASNKANPARFATGMDADGQPIIENVTDRVWATIERHKMEALVVIGGDGTMTCTEQFARAGLNCVGVPKTIDNDIHGTELTFGFQTAVAIATEALDRVATTAASHDRAIAVEVMGRNAGWIALHAGLASGADVILLPEIPFDLDIVCDHLKKRSARGKKFSILCIAEGAAPIGGKQFVERLDPTSPDPVRLGGIAQFVASKIEDCTGIETRSVVLGHVQRGGTPVAADRVLGTAFGHRALELLRAGQTRRMVAISGGRLTDIDLLEPADKQRKVPMDDPHIAAARAINVSFGDRPSRSGPRHGS